MMSRGASPRRPGGEPDIGTTASGLMAIGELHLDDDDLIDAAVAYLSEHAEAFPEVRIAVAGMEAVDRRSPAFEGWSAAILDRRNDDGTWGNGPSSAFETGGTAAAMLRMGVDFDRDDAVIAEIREGQQDDGGWSADGGPSDLSSTYRVVRGAFMMRAAPDLSALRDFVARCRRDDGGYAARPDEEASSIGATYMATILLRWADLLEGQEPVPETAGYRSLFYGRDLEGWEGDTSLWSASDGMLVGDSPGIDHNEFLAAEGEFGDFALRFSFQLDKGMGNSGVMFRSQRLPGHEMTGYQADIGEGYWGCLYDESRRNRVLQPASDEARAAVREGGWNQYEIRAMGPNIALTLNDQRSVTFEEEDEAIADSGRIAVQIHSGEAMEVRFRDLRIQRLPRPSADGDPKAPGFHLRTLEGSEGDYRYSVFVPEGYDGAKTFPVVLFLHGSGERGTDGVTPAQVGLGPIIAADPSAHPYIAVFPQARASWQADTADAALALRALDEGDGRLQGRAVARRPDGPLDGGGGGPGRSARPTRNASRRWSPSAGRARSRASSRSEASRPGCSSATWTGRRPLGGAASDRPNSPGTRRPGPLHRVPRRRPQQLGPRLQRARTGRVDAQAPIACRRDPNPHAPLQDAPR